MKVYVIRHGLTELNKQKKVNGEIDEPLTPEGIEQVKATIHTLPTSIKYIYSSPMLRARQTAEIIARVFKTPVLPIEELTEIHMGSLAGKSWEEMNDGLELKKQHRSIQFDYHLFGGEKAEAVKKRVISGLKKIKDEHHDNEVLIITHGGIIRTLHLLEHNQVITEDIKNISLHTFNIDKILQN